MHIFKNKFLYVALIISTIFCGCESSKILQTNENRKLQSTDFESLCIEEAEEALEELSELSTQKLITLWVVTEETTSDGMNLQLRTVADEFHEKYENIEIKIDILPTDKGVRQTYLKELHQKIERGEGPDIYLLPTRSVLTLDYPKQFSYCQIEPIFSSIDIAMRNGILLDIEPFYVADSSLEKEALNSSIMDAGLIGNKRFILPLRYNLPVIYSFDDEAESAGADLEAMDLSIDEWIKSVLSIQNPTLACGAEYGSFNAFSNLIDYDARRVTLTSDILANYFTEFQKLKSLIGEEYGHHNAPWLPLWINDSVQLYPVQIANLDSALSFAAISKITGKELSMHPVKSVSGDVIATITYYGAIGKNCENPLAAYYFLREFLNENYQWEMNRISLGQNQYFGLLEQSWPVRIDGCVPTLWENQQVQSSKCDGMPDSQNRLDKVQAIHLTQEDIPILNVLIDEVRFPLNAPNLFNVFAAQLNDIENGNRPTDVDIQELSRQVIESLRKEIE